MDRHRLTSYFAREQLTLLESIHHLALLSPESLRRRGLALAGLLVAGSNHGKMVLTGDCSGTRMRPGDEIELITDVLASRGKILEISFDEVTIEMSPKQVQRISGEVDIVLMRPTFYAPIFQSLRGLRPGSPGFGFAAMLFGERPIKDRASSSDQQVIDQLQCMAHTLMPELDESQVQAVRSALKRPGVLGIQGPPGTGKTRILALLGRLFTSSGHQVVITAYTHQAVCNALNETAELCADTDIRIVKIGSSYRTGAMGNRTEVMSFGDFERLRSRSPKTMFVVGLTVHSGIINLTLRQSSFLPEVLLVDEAGQIPFPLGVLLGRFWAGSVLLFGDDAQMPPVFSESLEHDPLSVSLFTKLRYQSSSSIKVLRTTYRLNGELTDVIGRHYYPDKNGTTKLEAASLDKGDKSDLPSGRLPSHLKVLLSEHSVRARVHRHAGHMTYNEAEAGEVAAVVDALLESGEDPRSMAIVSPFRRQCQLIRSRILEARPQLKHHSMPIVDTVERIQGMTVDTVLVSYGCSDSSYAGTIAEFLFSPNRLNVSLSRARSKALIFVSEEILHPEPETYAGMLAFTRFYRLLMECRSS